MRAGFLNARPSRRKKPDPPSAPVSASFPARAMAGDSALETLPRQVLAKILSPLDSDDLQKFGLALRDPHIAEEASWEALREFASRCDSPKSALASFNKMAGEPLKLCVDAVRRITEAFDNANDDRAYVIPPVQNIPDIDEPINNLDYKLASFIKRDIVTDWTFHLHPLSPSREREINHEDMRRWNDMHAEGGFWTEAPGKRDIACWLLFGAPCEHLRRAFAPDSVTADREDAFRDLFAEATRACVRVAASAYRDLLRATRRESRALAVPRVVVVARRLAEYGFFQEASALLCVILFDENNHELLGSGALTNELYVFLTELCCEAMYAETFVEPFAGEENFRAFANVVRVARLAVDRTTEDMKNENVVDKEPRGGKNTPKDLPQANEGTLQAVLDVLTPEYRASLHDIKIRYLEKKRRVAETRRTESTRREPETLELSYAHPVDRLAAAQHAYGRIMGLAHQQKYMQNDFADYPEVAAEIIPPTFIWPNHGKRLFRGKEMEVYARAAARGSGFLHSTMEDIRKAAHSMAATGEVMYCGMSVNISLAMRADGDGDVESAEDRLEEAVEVSVRCVRCFRDSMKMFDRAQKELAELALSRERGGVGEELSSVKRILRLEMGDAAAANGVPLLDASLYVMAKDFGKVLKFVGSYVASATAYVDPEAFEMVPGDVPGCPWVPWELMDENGELPEQTSVPNWSCSAEGDQWLLLAYACAAETYGPFHAHARNIERMFAMHDPRLAMEHQHQRVTPEEVRVRARAVARGYRADFKRREPEIARYL